MATELLLALIRANIAVSAAIVLALLLRRPARRLFGPQAAYALWLAAPAAMLGAVCALTTSAHPRHAAKALNQSAKAWLSAPDHVGALLAVWLFGVAAAVCFVTWSQMRVLASARAGVAGPAVLGVVHARLVTPDDFAERFTSEERALVRAHERAHIGRGDIRANALLVLAQCLCWFNPLLHMVARRPSVRRRYAETLLKTQLLRGSAAPLGCNWVTRGRHPLEARVATLARTAPPQARQDAGVVLLVMLGLALFYAAWAMQPAQPPWVAVVITLPMTLLLDLG